MLAVRGAIATADGLALPGLLSRLEHTAPAAAGCSALARDGGRALHARRPVARPLPYLPAVHAGGGAGPIRGELRSCPRGARPRPGRGSVRRPIVKNRCAACFGVNEMFRLEALIVDVERWIESMQEDAQRGAQLNPKIFRTAIGLFVEFSVNVRKPSGFGHMSMGMPGRQIWVGSQAARDAKVTLGMTEEFP